MFLLWRVFMAFMRPFHALFAARNLMQHYTLVGREWEEGVGAPNDAIEFFPT